MRRGKEIAQGSHASMAWLTRRMVPYTSHGGIRVVALTEVEQAWVGGSFTKIVCQVHSEQELLDIVARADEAGVLANVITDAGRTEFGGIPTVTAAAVGPDWAEKVDQVTGDLRLY